MKLTKDHTTIFNRLLFVLSGLIPLLILDILFFEYIYQIIPPGDKWNYLKWK